MKNFKYFILLVLFTVNFSLWAQNNTQNTSEKTTISQKVNNAFVPAVNFMDKVFFWDPFAFMGIYDPYLYDDFGNPVFDGQGNHKKMKVPLIVVWLFAGALFFTIKMKFVNFKAMGLSLKLIAGKTGNEKNTQGEVSHFQAVTTALSATVGLGNIAGVAIAIAVGGPGATFWMIIMGLLGMTSKFVECSLAVKYRKIDEDGHVSGGPMYYLNMGLKKRGLHKLGKVLAILFAVMVIGGSVGGGNMLQSNQAFAQFAELVPALAPYGFFFGLLMAFLVGIVVIGGIKSIARVTEKIVPFMALFYVLVALVIIAINIEKVGEVFALIFNGAFNGPAIKGGVLGVMVTGIQRAAFSNEAGIGSAAIAHSAAKTNEPISEGLVSLIEPMVDTVIICTMTALVIIFSGLYDNPDGLTGAPLTSAAFASVFPWFPYMLLVAIILFAFSTMISWSYYGLQGFNYLFARFFAKEKHSSLIYYFIFLSFIIIGSSSQLGAVMDFSDMMILTMAFPNILGLVIMSGEVKSDLIRYLNEINS